MKNVILALSFVFILHLTATRIIIPLDQPTIQGGINVATNGDTILVLNGTYIENINYNGKEITIASLFLTTQDTAFISYTIIDGNQNGSVVTFESGEDSTAVLKGFTITNGGGYCNGGGIYCSNSSPIISNNIISDNYTSFIDGAGIYITDEASPTVVWNIVKNNYSDAWGGGIYIRNGSSPYISRNVIIDNGQVNSHTRQKHDIPEKLFDDSEQVIIAGKMCYPENIDYSRHTKGGGILIANYAGLPTSPIIINNTIDGNIASEFGGGIYCTNATPYIRNNIISSNFDYGIYKQGNSLEVSYNDVWNNTNNFNGSVIEGIGNIHEDPLFVDQSMKNFNLLSGSPCIDDGAPNSPFDPDGTIVDMGALFYPQFTPPSADFTANPLFGITPLEVQFSDSSIPDYNPIISWSWDFDNDGLIDSEEQNPIYTFDELGSYTISLTVSDGYSNDMEIKENFIEVTETEAELVIQTLVTELYKNYPNPFNPSTEISFQISDLSEIKSSKIEIYNLKGQKIKTIPVILSPSAQLRTGLVEGSVTWNGVNESGKPVSSGVYYYRLNVNGTYTETHKAVLLK
jgi:parallel beta-helix repeat protein/predicted outer membrane repeat protein